MNQKTRFHVLKCSGVWCLFEFLLSSREQLELVFTTNVGVVGDDASFDLGVLRGFSLGLQRTQHRKTIQKTPMSPRKCHAAFKWPYFCEDRCKSFDIALEVGKKIQCLQVAKCQASSEEDKTLVSTHGGRVTKQHHERIIPRGASIYTWYQRPQTGLV